MCIEKIASVTSKHIFHVLFSLYTENRSQFPEKQKVFRILPFRRTQRIFGQMLNGMTHYLILFLKYIINYNVVISFQCSCKFITFMSSSESWKIDKESSRCMGNGIMGITSSFSLTAAIFVSILSSRKFY